jgi:hypothetical protein
VWRILRVRAFATQQPDQANLSSRLVHKAGVVVFTLLLASTVRADAPATGKAASTAPATLIGTRRTKEVGYCRS